MSGIELYFEKFKSEIRYCVHVDLEYDFASIVEQLMQKDNGIRYCYENGCLILKTDCFEIITNDGENITYEIDLSRLKKNEITVEGYSDYFDNINEKKEQLSYEKDKIDLLKFVKLLKKNMDSEDELIWDRVNKFKYRERYLSLKMYLEGDILRIKKRCLPVEQGCDSASDGDNNKVDDTKDKKSKSKLQSIVLDNKITIDVHKEELIRVIHELEKHNIEYKIGVEIVNIIGHCIEVECFNIFSSDFELIFCGNSLLQSYFYNDRMDEAYFVTTKGVKHNIWEIWKKEAKDGKTVYVEGYGADDAWHCAGCTSDGRDFYAIGYNL